jgi:prolyl oligopeptidase
MVQRPDLFQAVLTQVPVVDMLRYHLFTVARYWIPEYGNAENAEQFDFMRKYSPLHNVKEGENYPSTLVTTADHDDRVHPGQAKKYAARVQQANGSNNPVLLRIDTRAGHGAGKPIAKRIDESVDIYGFVMNELGMKPKQADAN